MSSHHTAHFQVALADRQRYHTTADGRVVHGRPADLIVWARRWLHQSGETAEYVHLVDALPTEPDPGAVVVVGTALLTGEAVNAWVCGPALWHSAPVPIRRVVIGSHGKARVHALYRGADWATTWCSSSSNVERGDGRTVVAAINCKACWSVIREENVPRLDNHWVGPGTYRKMPAEATR